MDISALEGKTLTDVKKSEDSLEFICEDGCKFLMYHSQSCCENVYIEDITSDWREILVGQKVLSAYESSNQDMGPKNDWDSSYTWTFYRIVTTGGAVVIRWYGTSNGYYSERVDFIQTNGPTYHICGPLFNQEIEIDGHTYRLR